MRYLAIAFTLLMVGASVAYAAPISGTTVKAVGGTSISVPHCRVLDYDIAASDTITSVNANVECDTTASFNVNGSVNSGAESGSGQTLAAFTADVPQIVAVSISPSVNISGQTYDADINVRR